MTTLSACHAGDIGDARVVTLGGVEDLSAVSGIEAHVWRNGTIATLSAAVTDAEAREVTIQLGTDAEDWLPAGPALGVWEGQVEATFIDGSELTWPNVGDAVFYLEVVREFG